MTLTQGHTLMDKIQSLISKDKMEGFWKITFFYIVLLQRKIEDQSNFSEVVKKTKQNKDDIDRTKENK